MDPVYYQMPTDSMVRPVRAEDWEPYRDIITAIYSQNTLAATMEQMKTAHGFSATVKQYKNKIKDWGLDNKYVKDYEYEQLLLLPAANEYMVRDKVVTYHDLMRYKRRKEKNHEKNGHGSSAGNDNAGNGSAGVDDSYADQYVDYSAAEGASGYLENYTVNGHQVGYDGYSCYWRVC